MKAFFNGDTRERKYNQSTVEWLEQEFVKLESTIGIHGQIYGLLEQAKEIEEKQRKQDIINAWNSASGGDAFHTGEDYYINLKSD